MLPKGPACVGCPLFGDGNGFVGDDIKPLAPVWVVGQNPGADEEAAGRPFVGKTGNMMNSFLAYAGLDRGQVSVSNALRCRAIVNGERTNQLPPLDKQVARDAVAHCTRAYQQRPEGAKLVIAQGAYALYATTGLGAQKHHRITDWRGYVAPYSPLVTPRQVFTDIWTPGPADLPVLATLHLASLYQDASMTIPTQWDWAKAGRILRGRWPQRMPLYRHERMLQAAAFPQEFTFDTEYDLSTGAMFRYSFCGADRSPVVVDAPFAGASAPHGALVIMQNAEADLDHLAELLPGVDLWDDLELEDTTYAHSVLWSGFPHDLNFLGSMYAGFNRWKHLMDTNPVLYSAGDAVGTWDPWVALQRELAKDPQSAALYQDVMKPLVPLVYLARKPGLRVDQPYAAEATRELRERVRDASLRAEAAAGFPINLASPAQVATQLYKVERVAQARGRGRAA